MSDFIQAEPQEGAPATERTEAWVTFDREYVYISFRCWESRPERMVANEMRRDSGNIFQGDFVGFTLDTFYDRRTAVLFTVNAIGGRTDGQVSDERQYNGDWNPIWHVAVGRFDGGWTVETAVPFKSLQYRPGRAQVWGFNLRRDSQWRNEISYIAPIPIAMATNGLQMTSFAATLVDLEAPEGSRNLEIKPYAISEVSGDRTATPKISNDLGGDLGLDVKYGLTQNLTADLTVNTDFAQVEADTQQINLTRFSLFFPEKREFFLENRGLFAFGGAGRSGFGGGGGDTPVLFHSRQIGLHQGQEVPIEVGGRLTGRVGAFSLGVVNIQTGDATVSGAPATNFSVVRVKRDILRRSSIGAPRHEALGLDARPDGVERRVWGRWDVRVLRRPEHQHLLGGDPDAGARRGYRELPNAARLHRRPLWAPAGTAGGGERLQSGGRVSPSLGVRAQLRVGPVQPPAAGDRRHPEAVLEWPSGLHHGSGWGARDPRR